MDAESSARTTKRRSTSMDHDSTATYSQCTFSCHLPVKTYASECHFVFCMDDPEAVVLIVPRLGTTASWTRCSANLPALYSILPALRLLTGPDFYHRTRLIKSVFVATSLQPTLYRHPILALQLTSLAELPSFCISRV
jgi:hypothetical protein